MLFDLKAVNGPKRINGTSVELAVIERLDRIIELLEGTNAKESTQVPLPSETEDK